MAPPHAVPPTRAKWSSLSTRTTETPEPMLTSRNGKSGSGHATATSSPPAETVKSSWLALGLGLGLRIGKGLGLRIGIGKAETVKSSSSGP